MIKDILRKAIVDGRVTSQSDAENATCLGKIIDIDKVLKEYEKAFKELANDYENFLKINPYKFEEFNGAHYVPTDMFRTANIDAYLLAPTGENNVLIRVKFDSLNEKYAYQNTIAGDNPMILVIAIRIGNNMCAKIFTNKGGEYPSYYTSWGGSSVSEYNVLCTDIIAPTIQFFSNATIPMKIYHLVKEGE